MQSPTPCKHKPSRDHGVLTESKKERRVCVKERDRGESEKVGTRAAFELSFCGD